jgi:NADPH:quinone reductase-like Zn-dependent oxidoreductase
VKAIIWTKYGPPEVLQLQEVPKPIPKDGEVLIKIHAAAVTRGDCELRNMTLPVLYRLPMRLYMGFAKPTRTPILGMALAGEVEAVGSAVQTLRPGDQVFAATELHFGAYAEYVCLPADGPIAIKPAHIGYAEAAAVPLGGLEALHFLQGEVQEGEKVLINGAGGSIGSFAVQLAKCYGAEVTAVDSTSKLAHLRSLGADRVVDYTQRDFTRSGEVYDLILDVTGTVPYGGALRSLRSGGKLLVANPGPAHMLRGPWAERTSGKQVRLASSEHSREGLLALKSLIEEGKLRSVIDRCFPLEEAAAAHHYIESGQKVGDVVLTMHAPAPRGGG